ncbi:MAG: hypothetical protein JW993_17525 [Sedimentisphaerales bacterium]|nr:hypothetical protein [Sedimentisphaerales bacterium]
MVEREYSVRRHPKGRALSGLSMGGRHTLFVGFNSLDLFANFGVLSAGDVNSETSIAAFLNDPNVNEKVDYLFVGQGTGEAEGRMGARCVALHEALTNHKIEHDYYVGGHGGHDWSTWRHWLYYRFLPNLRRKNHQPRPMDVVENSPVEAIHRSEQSLRTSNRMVCRAADVVGATLCDCPLRQAQGKLWAGTGACPYPSTGHSDRRSTLLSCLGSVICGAGVPEAPRSPASPRRLSRGSRSDSLDFDLTHQVLRTRLPDHSYPKAGLPDPHQLRSWAARLGPVWCCWRTPRPAAASPVPPH